MPRTFELRPCGSCGVNVYVGGDGRVREVVRGSARLHSCGPVASEQQAPIDPRPTFRTWRDEAQQLNAYQVELNNVIRNSPSPWMDVGLSNVTGTDAPEPDIPFEEEGVPDLPNIDPAAWWSPPLPDGVSWYGYPADSRPGTVTISVERPDYAAVLDDLRDWAEENNFRLAIYRTAEMWAGGTYLQRPSRIFVGHSDPETTDPDVFDDEGRIQFESNINCPICLGMHPAYTAVCPSTDLYLCCSDCGRAAATTRQNNDRGVTFAARSGASAESLGLLCSMCSSPCSAEGCEAMVSSNRSLCSDHGQHATCGPCGNSMEAPIDDEEPWPSNGTWDAICESCEGHICPNCDNYSDSSLTFSGDLNLYVCRRCFREALAGTGEEEFDADATMTARTLRIPTIPGRENIRNCGVEIEGGNGTGNGNMLAGELCEAGLSDYEDMLGYHSGARGFSHVERDSSVDWELVVGPLNPAVRDDVSRFGRVIRTVRTLVHDGVLKLDLRAGCHVHIEAAGVSLDGAFNLNTLFAYAEDVIFRLGAAKWPIHRAIQGSDYARPVPKESRKLAFARAMDDTDSARYYALSFNNYFRQMLNGCRCGAVRYDSWDECACDLGKCTFEFRVFNTTANPRKLHAYMALTQALVAKALKLGTIEDPAHEFPALTFVPKRFKDMTDEEQTEMVEEWQERLLWLFTELPLTNEEKESLAYCVRNSELVNVGDDFINGLVPVAAEQQVIEEVLA